MPQLDFVSYFSQISWVLISFIFLFISFSQGFLPSLARTFWFREFKKLVFAADFGIVNAFRSGLFSVRGSLTKIISFRSVAKSYCKAAVEKKTFIIKKVWLVLNYFYIF